MDVQIKKGLLDACVLAALEHGESYGYKIIDDTRSVIEISESTLYPILKRLELAGFLTARTGEYNGRLRKYYRITPPGVNRLREFREMLKGMDKIYTFILGINSSPSYTKGRLTSLIDA